MDESYERRLDRLDRIVRGENGYYTGLVQRLASLEQKVSHIEQMCEELQEAEEARQKREAQIITKQERADEVRRKWLIAIVPPVVLLALASILGIIRDLFILAGGWAGP